MFLSVQDAHANEYRITGATALILSPGGISMRTKLSMLMREERKERKSIGPW